MRSNERRTRDGRSPKLRKLSRLEGQIELVIEKGKTMLTDLTEKRGRE